MLFCIFKSYNLENSCKQRISFNDSLKTEALAIIKYPLACFHDRLSWISLGNFQITFLCSLLYEVPYLPPPPDSLKQRLLPISDTITHSKSAFLCWQSLPSPSIWPPAQMWDKLSFWIHNSTTETGYAIPQEFIEGSKMTKYLLTAIRCY